MTGQLRPTIAQRRQLAKARSRRHPNDHARPSRRQLLAIVFIWLVAFAAALWLAAHDPDYLSRAVERAIGGAV